MEIMFVKCGKTPVRASSIHANLDVREIYFVLSIIVREPNSSIRELSKPHIRHKDMLGSYAFSNFLSPARNFHRKMKGLLTVSGTLQRRNFSFQI